MRYITALAVVAALTLSGCATVSRQWEAVGGSRADGTVRLAMTTYDTEQVVADDAQGQSLAAQKCAAWGYTGAEAFGAVNYRCERRGGFSGCMERTRTREYQCTGSPPPR